MKKPRLSETQWRNEMFWEIHLYADSTCDRGLFQLNCSWLYYIIPREIYSKLLSLKGSTIDIDLSRKFLSATLWTPFMSFSGGQSTFIPCPPQLLLAPASPNLYSGPGVTLDSECEMFSRTTLRFVSSS